MFRRARLSISIAYCLRNALSRQMLNFFKQLRGHFAAPEQLLYSVMHSPTEFIPNVLYWI